MNKRLTVQRNACQPTRLVRVVFSIWETARSPSCLFPFRSSLITIECARTPTSARLRGREGGCRTGKGVRRENFANGRIIKGDSDHVSGTVHTVTSSQWTPLVGTRLAGEQRCTRTRLSASYTSLSRPG